MKCRPFNIINCFLPSFKQITFCQNHSRTSRPETGLSCFPFMKLINQGLCLTKTSLFNHLFHTQIIILLATQSS
uniref:Uncharacterized protein n=1 Tax=Zea mays TaxID=4577 RepID=C0PP18_MAIZE|nr:unknown [Zea mays]